MLWRLLSPLSSPCDEAGFDAVSIQRYPEVEALNHVHHAGNSSGIVDARRHDADGIGRGGQTGRT